MEVKLAGAEAAAAVGDIHAESWKGAYRGIVPDSYLDKLEGSKWLEPLRQWMESGSLTVWLLVDGQEPVGCVSFGAGREADLNSWGEIVSLYLYPERFRKGGGSLLMEKALLELKKSGFADVYLWVLEDNHRARAFYEKHGFHPNGDTIEMEIEGKPLKEVRYIRHLNRDGRKKEKEKQC